MLLLITPCGAIRCLYEEAVDLAALGNLRVERASHVEPDARGRWTADLSPMGGPLLGPFALRSEALVAEQRWLEENWLIPGEGPG